MGAAGGDQKTTYSVVLENKISGSADDAADSMEALRKRVLGGQEAIMQMQGSMKRLRGDTDAVRQAKENLVARVNAERDAVSAATLQLHKAGTSFEALTKKRQQDAAAQVEAEKARQKEILSQQELAKKHKALQDELKKSRLTEEKERTNGFSAAVKLAGGPVADLKDRIGALRDIAGGAGGRLALMAGAATALVAAVAAAVVGVGAAVVAFTKWAVSTANAARTAGLLREAVTGSAADAARLGNQVDLLARKVPTAKDELNALAVSLRKNRLGGDLLVDTLNAVAQASAGLGEDTGAKVREIIERSRMTGRVAINPQELLGSGLDFKDIADQLAKQMGVGVEKARAALFEGRVAIGDGAKAIRATVEKQLAALNLRKMLDLNVLATKFGETIDMLVKHVKLDAFLEAAGKIAAKFDASTRSGIALQTAVGGFAQSIVDGFTKGAPLVGAFIDRMIIGALKLGIAYLDLRIALKNAFASSDTDASKLLNLGMGIAGVGASVLSALLRSLAGTLLFLGGILDETKNRFLAIYDIVAAVQKLFTGGDWKSAGSAIGKGLVQGILGQKSDVFNAVGELATGSEKRFRTEIDAHSPSRKFDKSGRDIPRGLAQGVEAEAPDAQAAVAGMLGDASPAGPASSSGAGGAGGQGGGPRVVIEKIEIHVSGGGGEAAAKALTEPSFLATLTKAIEDACSGQGIPVQQ